VRTTTHPDTTPQVYAQSIQIAASPERVEQTIVDPALMQRWLNPLLNCAAVGEWQTSVGSQFRFSIQLPIWQPTLMATVIERQPGLIVWQFTGFFVGQDLWHCQPAADGTLLVNRFQFEIENPVVAFGFQTFASGFTRRDMQAQLQRLKQVAELGN
jgi:hypothetical protein